MVQFLPTRLLYTRDETVTRKTTKTNPADAEFPIDCPAPAAQLASVADADFIAGPHLRFFRLPPARIELGELAAKFDIFCFGGHNPAHPEDESRRKAKPAPGVRSPLV